MIRASRESGSGVVGVVGVAPVRPVFARAFAFGYRVGPVPRCQAKRSLVFDGDSIAPHSGRPFEIARCRAVQTILSQCLDTLSTFPTVNSLFSARPASIKCKVKNNNFDRQYSVNIVVIKSLNLKFQLFARCHAGLASVTISTEVNE